MPIIYSQESDGQWWGTWTGPRGNRWRAKAIVVDCCAVGCGARFPRLPWIVKRSRKGSFCSHQCVSKSRLPHERGHARRGSAHHHWTGGKHIISGYVYVLCRDHPSRQKRGYVAEHRLVMEKILDRYLFDDETVHHINGNRQDNSPGNLELWSSNHPKGQRIGDLVLWAHEILKRYESHNWSFTNVGQLPPGATTPLPREYKPYEEN